MKKKQLERQLSDLFAVISQFEKNNMVVIERYNNWGISLEELIEERSVLLEKYTKRWGFLSKKNILVESEN